jgi:hypothetical protein
MYTILLGSQTLGIRLPEKERERFLKKYGTTLLEAYGTVMKEYVAMPDSLLGKTKELKKYLDLSFEYAGTLKPKPAKRDDRMRLMSLVRDIIATRGMMANPQKQQIPPLPLRLLLDRVARSESLRVRSG